MKLSPHEIAHVVLTEFVNVPATDPTTEISNQLLAVAVALAESAGETDAMHVSNDVTSENYGQVDHGLFQISGRWNSERLIRLGDWRDPYINARMARELFDEWWRKEHNPAYMAEKRKTDPAWQPSGWRAWSVYTSGTAWRLKTSTVDGKTYSRNLYLDQARFGLGAAVPAPRPFNRRGPGYVDPVWGQMEAMLERVGVMDSRVSSLARVVDEIRRVYAP